MLLIQCCVISQRILNTGTAYAKSRGSSLRSRAIIGLYICRKEVLINSHVRVIAEQCFESQSFYDFCLRPQRGIEGFLFPLIYY